MKRVVTAAVVLFASMGAAFAGNPADGEVVFKKCVACHSVGEGAKNKVGPILKGLDSRKSGTVEGYSYSDANKNLGITCPTEYLTDAGLRALIRDPRSVRVWPEQRMPGFSGDDLSDEDLGLILAYLRHMVGRKSQAIGDGRGKANEGRWQVLTKLPRYLVTYSRSLPGSSLKGSSHSSVGPRSRCPPREWIVRLTSRAAT